MRKRTIIMALALASIVITVPVFAYMYITEKQIPAGVAVKTPTVAIGVYWDDTGQPVTSIDFGEIPQPNSLTALVSERIKIVNKGDVPLTIYWNSTLSSITNEITDGRRILSFLTQTKAYLIWKKHVLDAQSLLSLRVYIQYIFPRFVYIQSK